jgi:hypothetical protein
MVLIGESGLTWEEIAMAYAGKHILKEREKQ